MPIQVPTSNPSVVVLSFSILFPFFDFNLREASSKTLPSRSLHKSPSQHCIPAMAVSRLFRQNNGSAVVFLGIGVVPLLIALGTILAAPHSVLAAPCDPQVSGYGPTTS